MLTVIKAFKLVSLGVLNTGKVNIDEPHHSTGLSVLRDSAQWFPRIPDEILCLNETTCFGLPTQPCKYRPLSMMLYGGLGGMHLSKLVGIVVWIVDFERIYGVDFMYNVEVDGQKIHTLGRRGPFSDNEPRDYEPCDSSTDQCISFEIDGPGGEIIDGLGVQVTKDLPVADTRGFRVSITFVERQYAYYSNYFG